MTDQRQAALDYARQHQTEFLDSLKALVAIPSISTDPEAKVEMTRAAEWVADRLKALGIEKVAIMPTAGHPVVYGEWLGAPGKPVALIYGHYDVQPVDPLELWKTGPFEPTVVGENLYGRGASDMKGQVLAALSALEALVKTGGLPVNVKFLLEGEEEIGSPSLGAWIEEHKALLQADFCLNPDSGMLGKEYPTITYGLRGLSTYELRVYGPAGDLHSPMGRSPSPVFMTMCPRSPPRSMPLSSACRPMKNTISSRPAFRPCGVRENSCPMSGWARARPWK